MNKVDKLYSIIQLARSKKNNVSYLHDWMRYHNIENSAKNALKSEHKGYIKLVDSSVTRPIRNVIKREISTTSNTWDILK